jgi:hypothetical protein
MRNWQAVVLVTISLIALQACAGSMKGVVRRDAKRIEITYSDSRIGQAILRTALPDGERFEGKLVKIGAADSQSNAAAAGSASADFGDVILFDGNAEATLFGEWGNIMKCRFHLTDSIIGLSSGGFGLCQDSRGRAIDIFF